MALKLLNKKMLHSITVEDTVIRYRTLDNGQKIEIAQRMQMVDNDGSGWNECLRIVGGVIESIEGHENENPSDVLVAIEDAGTQSKILTAIMTASGLTKDEVKNSHASLDSMPTESSSTREHAEPSDTESV